MAARSSGSMDVRCERCGSQYELEEDRVTEAGVAVRCTHCDHVCRVKKQAVAVTSSISELNGPRSARPPAPNAARPADPYAGATPKAEPMPPNGLPRTGPGKPPPSPRSTPPFGTSLEEFGAGARPPPPPGPSAAPRDRDAVSFENYFRTEVDEPCVTRSASRSESFEQLQAPPPAPAGPNRPRGPC